MQITKKSTDRRRHSKKYGHLVGCVICVLLVAAGLLAVTIHLQSLERAREEALRVQKEGEAKLALQQEQLKLQQQKLAEQEREEQRQREAQELLEKQQREEREAKELLERQKLEAKQQAQYEKLKEELAEAEQKIVSIASVVDPEAAAEQQLDSSELAKTLNGVDNEGQIQKVKEMVDRAEAKIHALEAVFS